MTAQIIDGKDMAKAVFAAVREGVEKSFHDRKPGLAALCLGGEDDSSRVYLNSQTKAAARVGIGFREVRLPVNAAERDVRAAILELNGNRDVDGILLQRPLPEHLDGN